MSDLTILAQQRSGPLRAHYFPINHMSDAAFTAIFVSAVLFTVFIILSVPRLDD